MQTLTQADIRRMLNYLEAIEELTGILRQNYLNVPYPPISRAISATLSIRDTLLRASLADVQVETVTKFIPSIPARETETV